MPLEEILLAATTLKFFVNAEPAHYGCWRLSKTAYEWPMNSDITHQGMDQASMHPSDIKQGSNGNCWFLGAVIAILAKPGGDQFISGMMRDMSRKILINGRRISIGKLIGLKNDNVILIRLFDGLQPHYVLVNKSYVNGNFRSRAPTYVQMLEKAYIGYFLNGDFNRARGGRPETLFNTFIGGQGGKVVSLDISQKREKSLSEFSNIFNKEIKTSFELLNEIFEDNKELIEIFKKLRSLADSKKNLTPDAVINLMKEAAVKIKIDTTRIDSGKLESVINCLERYALSLKDDHTYHPVFASNLERLLIKISSLPLQASGSEREAVLTHLRPATISFDAKKVKAEQSWLSWGMGEPVSRQGFIGKHSFAVSHTGKMVIKPSPDSKEIKQFTIVHIVNPWGHTGVSQMYSESEQGLIPVRSESNVSVVTIDDLIRFGRVIVYEPGISFHPEYRDEVSKSAMIILSSTPSQDCSPSTGLKESGLFSAKTTPSPSAPPVEYSNSIT